MADPVYDEDAIIDMLKTLPGPQQTVPVLQNACLMALLDLYDRKADRMFFAQHAGMICTTYAMLSRTWMLMSMHDIFENGNLTEATFNKAHADIIQMVTENTEQIIAMVQKLKECPTSEDKVH